jgi:hypothetical protein
VDEHNHALAALRHLVGRLAAGHMARDRRAPAPPGRAAGPARFVAVRAPGYAPATNPEPRGAGVGRGGTAPKFRLINSLR